MIKKGAVSEYLKQDLDSFTWLKHLPRQTILDEFKYFKVKPVFKGHERWTHQLVSFYIGCCCDDFLFLLDMGLGKSAIILDILTQKVREKKVKKAFITVPRLINLGSWENDILQHSDFEPILADGSIEEKWIHLIEAKGDLAIIDYPGLQLALTKRAPVKNDRGKIVKGKYKLVRDDSKVAQLRKIYNFFAIDESHKAKNKDALRFSLLRALTGRADYRYASTGTLFGRKPEDIWPQFLLIDRGETFGDTIGLFREAFFNPVSNGFGTKYEFNKGMYRPLYRFLQHRSIRYTEQEVPEVELPARVVRRITVRFADDQREHYLRAVQGLIDARGSLREIDSAFIRMRQIAAGYLQWSDEDGKHLVSFTENWKLQALEKIIEESGESKVVVSTEYTQSGQLVADLCLNLGHKYEWLHGGAKDAVRMVNRFIQDPDIKVFIMNSESGGTGTDGLQKVARHLVFYESPASPITRTQTLKRVHRPGQLHRTFIWDIVLEKSIDLRILSLIEEGKNLYDNIVNGRISRNELI